MLSSPFLRLTTYRCIVMAEPGPERGYFVRYATRDSFFLLRHSNYGNQQRIKTSCILSISLSLQTSDRDISSVFSDARYRCG